MLVRANVRRNQEMTRQEHHMRQMKWFEELSKYGFAEIEPSIKIRDAVVYPDVYGKIENIEFIIEIGDVDDKRKEALLEIYAEKNPLVVFVHEHYGEDKLGEVLGRIDGYQSSPEVKNKKHLQELTLQLEEHTKEIRRKNNPRFFFAIIAWGICVGSLVYSLEGVYGMGVVLAGMFVSSLPLFGLVLLMGRRIKKGCICSQCELIREKMRSLQVQSSPFGDSFSAD
jgi:hypothetical protein